MAVDPFGDLLRAALKRAAERQAVDFPAEFLTKILEIGPDFASPDGTFDAFAEAITNAYKRGIFVPGNFAQYQAQRGSKPRGPARIKRPNVLFSWEGVELCVKIFWNELGERLKTVATGNFDNDLAQAWILLREPVMAALEGVFPGGVNRQLAGLPVVPMWRYWFDASLAQPSKGRKKCRCPKPSAQPSVSSASSATGASSSATSTTQPSSQSGSTRSSKDGSEVKVVITESVESKPPFEEEMRGPRWEGQILTTEEPRLVREIPSVLTDPLNPSANGANPNDEETEETDTARPLGSFFIPSESEIPSSEPEKAPDEGETPVEELFSPLLFGLGGGVGSQEALNELETKRNAFLGA